MAQWERICMRCRRPGFDPWVRKIAWRRKWQPTPAFLPGESHGQRSLVGCSPWGHRVRHNWATTRPSLCKMIPWRRQWHQYSYLENPRDRGAWWAAVHRVTVSRTWLRDWAHTPGKISTHRALPVSVSPFSICVCGWRDVLSLPLDYLWKCWQQPTQTKKWKFIITWSCQYFVVGHLDQNVIFPLLLN